MDILKRLSEYNPPDMLYDEMIKEIAIDIQDAKNEIEQLREALHDCIYVLAMDGAVEGSLRVIEIASVALQQKESE